MSPFGRKATSHMLPGCSMVCSRGKNHELIGDVDYHCRNMELDSAKTISPAGPPAGSTANLQACAVGGPDAECVVLAARCDEEAAVVGGCSACAAVDQRCVAPECGDAVTLKSPHLEGGVMGG